MMAMGDQVADRPGPPAGGRWAPLIPLVVAVAVGIIVDRYAEPWATSTWVALAVGAGAAALMGTNRELAGSLAVVAAFGASAAGGITRGGGTAIPTTWRRPLTRRPGRLGSAAWSARRWACGRTVPTDTGRRRDPGRTDRTRRGPGSSST